MSHDVLAFTAMIFFMAHTPGPNNLILMRSGIMFGYKKTIPNMAGVFTGASLIFLALNLGLLQLFERFPAVVLAIKIFGSLYMVYLAVLMIKSKPHAPAAEKGAASEKNSGAYGKKNARAENAKPFSFLQATLFQFINIKAYLGPASALALLADTEKTVGLLVALQGVYAVFMISSAHLWAVGGVVMQKLLQNRTQMLIINCMLALFLGWVVVSLWI